MLRSPTCKCARKTKKQMEALNLIWTLTNSQTFLSALWQRYRPVPQEHQHGGEGQRNGNPGGKPAVPASLRWLSTPSSPEIVLNFGRGRFGNHHNFVLSLQLKSRSDQGVTVSPSSLPASVFMKSITIRAHGRCDYYPSDHRAADSRDKRWVLSAVLP